MNALFARHALLPEGWQGDVLIEWDARGNLTRVEPRARPPIGVARADYVVPGMVNLHSHAFQRALGGLTEKAGDGPDSFWTWRELMYRFAQHITPEQVEAIAAQLFSECLRHGYTALCEFHYIQRDPAGAMYARPAEMAERVAAAGQQSGIGLTVLPVLYSHSGFGDQPLKPEQKRFQTDVDTVLRIVEALAPLRNGQLEVGAAPHSLRAAGIKQIQELIAALPKERPLHIHIAEQQGEVQQSLDFSGRRPVEYLFDQLAVDARWCLVHATHLNEAEVAQLATSGAVAGLCPSTEANLGDGLFPLADYLAQGGRWGIGSDSHVSQSPVEELRWLEYGQRLIHQRRNVAATPARRDVALNLWQDALLGGAQAAGRPVGALVQGRRADLLVLDAAHPNLDGVLDADVLGRLVFCGNDNLVRDVLAGGRWVVQGGRHMAQEAIGRRYRQALQQLREG
ncbi:formimidoylglutamate deiminase [Massilia sp. Mn16-1_5]|uniref:formimidoylglutamate deiminase n=1 Tax=Massilia sp. Mn16-1_5 TaxID=2079199 RepID=UPI00109EAE4C|nr:formimidoylglutamate deiminase [Massilia sp. Mn16-1_5]THC42847.1 formimidoylglutamate deiminase [Massilia sp. Mn16-1_5]